MKKIRLKQLCLVVFIILTSACTTSQPKISQPENNEDLKETVEIAPEIAEDSFVEATEEIPDRPGIILNFDDYHPVAWERHFDLFDTYNAKVTFFVHEMEVAAGRKKNIFDFCLAAQKRGHEIGYHTISHPELTTVSRGLFFEQTVSRIGIFRDAGIELTSFAYPYGTYRPWMHEELLKYYKIVRGISGHKLYTADEMKFGFLDSESIDNIRFKSDDSFQNRIDNLLKSAKDAGKIIILTSHSISGNDYGITTKRLEYVLSKCKEYDITFYRFKDFQ